MHKFLGFGLKLNAEHYKDILASQHNVDWFEILTEDYLDINSEPYHHLRQIAERYPISMHGVSLSIGSTDPVDYTYLKQLKALATEFKPLLISDHLCWTGVNKINTHDLLPLPYTSEAINHVVNKVKQVQDYLGRQILIENVSSYLTYNDSVMSEWEFLSEISNQADCLLLLDVNNIYVSAFNHKFNPLDYIKGVPAKRVAEIHIAGHSNRGEYIIDTHDTPIIEEVWQLYTTTLKTIGQVPTLIERDDNIPPLDELVAELDYARIIAGE